MHDAKQTARLVLRAQAGDSKALDALLQSVQEPLFRYIRGIIGEDMLAEDVLQDVFVRICRKLKWLREPRVFSNWAFRIAGREALRRLRRERHWRDQLRTEIALDELPETHTASRYDPDLVRQVLALMESVPLRSRMVLLLHYQHEHTLPEVADILGIPLGTAKSRLAYGLALLRTRLQHESASPP